MAGAAAQDDTREKLALTFEMTDGAMRAAEEAEREAHPELSERAVFLRVAARRLGRDLMIKAYGWDPGPDFAWEPLSQ